MPDNIFEVRSSEVQDVLSRPPAQLIIWGNTVILLVMLTIVQLLNIVKLPVYINLKSDSIVSDTVINKSRVIILSSDAIPAEWHNGISKTKHLVLYTKYHLSSKEDAISYWIDKVTANPHNKTYELFYQGDLKDPHIEKKLIAGVAVETGKLSILQKFINSLVL
jgi:hypothetical protein